MEQALYLNDCYLREFESAVTEANGKYVVLEQTAFYPNAGGQPHDTGTLDCGGREYRVIYAGKFSNQVSHEVDREGLKPGDRIRGRIDWDRRYLLMRYHTASHVLSGVLFHRSGALITGNQISPERTRIDFSLEGFDRDLIDKCIAEANGLIKRDLPVEIYAIARAEAEQTESLSKLAKGLPPDISEIRIVEIKGFDRQPDGGTHVKSLSEVGPLELLKCENKGAKNRRVYFKLKNEK
ncbi:MAG: alanyl-tRNA editing protein AlaXM [archaeon]